MLSALVAVVFHSDVNMLSSCLSSISAANLHCDVVVCDTSRDGDAKATVQEHGYIWHSGARNGGYAWALQAVGETWSGEYDVFVGSNSDLCFAEGALTRLVSHARELGGACYVIQHATDGSVGSHSVQPQLSVRDAFARWIGVGRAGFRLATASVITRAVRDRLPVELPAGLAGSGAVIAVPREVWERIGGFDSDFFLFEEDRSFGTRLDQLDIPAYLCGDCDVIHAGGFSTRGLSKLGTLECVVSERIAWEKFSTGPPIVLRLLQWTGLVGRIVAGLFMFRFERVRVYGSVFRAISWTGRRPGAALYGSDGARVAARTV